MWAGARRPALAEHAVTKLANELHHLAANRDAAVIFGELADVARAAGLCQHFNATNEPRTLCGIQDSAMPIKARRPHRSEQGEIGAIFIETTFN